MFNYKWYLKDNYKIEGVEKHGKKVFSTFACGGGSTMGYKLAGFDVIGANDIDKEIAKIYKINHNPKYYFLESIADFRLRDDLPEDLYNLDILDGSPPCSTFSMAGSREKTWKKDKKFREGQEKQVLSDLFFEWIALVNKLKPKVAIAENVKGMLVGNAKIYTKNIVKELNKIGYDVQLFLLNGATMGLPQARERVFFICSRKEFNFPKLKLNFSEKVITYGDISEGIIKNYKKLMPSYGKLYDKMNGPGSLAKVHPKGSFFNQIILDNKKPMNTITSDCQNKMFNPDQKRCITNKEILLGGSYPLDYNFLGTQPVYAVGMSVPPLMTANIAYAIYMQWFKK